MFARSAMGVKDFERYVDVVKKYAFVYQSSNGYREGASKNLDFLRKTKDTARASSHLWAHVLY